MEAALEEARGNDHLPSGIEDMIHGVETTLLLEEKCQLWELVKRYRDVFAIKGKALSRTDVVRHEIDKGTFHPIQMPPRWTPIHQVDAAKQALEEMQKAGVISPSDDSP